MILDLVIRNHTHTSLIRLLFTFQDSDKREGTLMISSPLLKSAISNACHLSL